MAQGGEAPRIRLIGPPMAPPVELARWLLEARRRPHEFVTRAAGLSAFASIRHKVPVELPLLLFPEGPVGGLLPSLAAIEDRLAPRETLFPQAGDRAFVWTLGAELFAPAVKTFYARMLPHPRLLAPRATAGVPLTDALVVRLAYPAWAALMRSGLKLAEFDPEAAAAEIDRIFAEVGEALAGKAFLHGAAPGIRDVVFAVLASPVILPPGHPASIPRLEELPEPFREQVARWRATAAGQLALRVYEGRPAVRDHGRAPSDAPKLLQRVVTPKVIRGGMRLLAASGPRVLKLGAQAFIPRYDDVQEVLQRDGDFLIAPVNATRIEGVMGPFILGMDGGPALQAQREALYAALEAADQSRAMALCAAEAERLAGDAARRFGKIDVVDGYARPVAARAAADVFGVTGPSEADLMRAARAVFHETFLNLGGDKAVQTAGRAAGAEIAAWIGEEVARRNGRPTPRGDLIDQLTAQVKAGTLPAEQVSWITAGLLVGAIDTTATAVANIIKEATADPVLLAGMTADVDDPRRLLGWCLEALRRRAHNPLVLRETRAAVSVAGKTLPPQTRVWALTLGAMQDPRVFTQPSRMDPMRPLDRYLHFGGGLHRCSGRQLNVRNIPALVAPLLRRKVSGPADLRFRGPFPDRLVVNLERPPA
jgi:cytochrome P450